MVPDPAGRDSLLGEVAVTRTLVAEALKEQKLVPGHAGAPVTLQLANVQPAAGVGVSFTMTLRAKSKLLELHDTPQLIPAGVETIVPWPVLFRVTVLTSRKVGVTVVLAFSGEHARVGRGPARADHPGPAHEAAADIRRRLQRDHRAVVERRRTVGGAVAAV